MTKRHVSLPDGAEAGLRGFLRDVDDRLAAADGPDDLADTVAEILVDLHGERDAWERYQAGETVSPVEQARLQAHHPDNATLESEHYAEKDETAYARSKPLQYLWRRFDASPLADNVEFALRFRRLLAEHLFADVGENVRLFKGISMTYGHNLSIGDNTVIHDDVHLDDRGRLEIGDRVSLSDGAHVYSHDHDVVDQTEVTNYRTVVEDDARVTQGTLVRAGVHIGENALVGARAVVQGDVPAHHVVVGMPAKSIGPKPGFEATATDLEDGSLPDRRADRELPYALPEDLDVFDEFQRPSEYEDAVDPHREP
jgi:acetyltransferase-like isoleucine patch superfamily enzyme